MKHLEKLKDISKEMKVQDNRLSSYPYFIVYDRRSIPMNPDYSPITSNAGDNGRTIYVHTELEDSEFDSVEELIEDGKASGYFESAEYEAIEQFKEEIREIYVQDIDVLKGVFLTEKAAKDFIDSQAHHLDRPYIYGESFYDNDEMRTVSEAIASLTPEVPPHPQGIGY